MSRAKRWRAIAIAALLIVGIAGFYTVSVAQSPDSPAETFQGSLENAPNALASSQTPTKLPPPPPKEKPPLGY